MRDEKNVGQKQRETIMTGELEVTDEWREDEAKERERKKTELKSYRILQQASVR